jgi:shikimate kinase
MMKSQNNLSGFNSGQALPKRIFLIGFMGSGKTTVGKRLAELMHYTFIDMDSQIEADEAMAIRDIFIKRGEHHFRNQESRLLDQLALQTDIVVSCGGGIIHDAINVDCLKKSGPAVFLDGSATILFERVKNDVNRPFAFLDLGNEQQRYEKFTDLYEKRRCHYSEASLFAIKIDGKTPGQIASEIIDAFALSGVLF